MDERDPACQVVLTPEGQAELAALRARVAELEELLADTRSQVVVPLEAQVEEARGLLREARGLLLALGQGNLYCDIPGGMKTISRIEAHLPEENK